MRNDVVKASIGHGESVAVALKGFYWGAEQVVVTMFDEPGNKKLIVTCGDKRIERALPKPHDAAS